jgi:hypothetical protein
VLFEDISEQPTVDGHHDDAETHELTSGSTD